MKNMEWGKQTTRNVLTNCTKNSDNTLISIFYWFWQLNADQFKGENSWQALRLDS